MGGACSVGGRITSDELDHHHHHPPQSPSQSQSQSQSPQITPTNNKKKTKKTTNKKQQQYSNSMLISSINDKLKRIKSFGNLNKTTPTPTPTAAHDDFPRASPQRFFSGELRFSSSSDKQVTPRGSSFIGRAGLDKAVDVLDALGSGITNLNSSGFLTSKIPKSSNKISILAFEVANTISRGDRLLHSLSTQNTTFIKEHLIPSHPVHRLVSSDTNLLLTLVAADKREELDVFCKEVTRFGNHCKDPQWHNLDRYFTKLDSDNAAYRQEREQAETKMIELLSLAEHTSELYHELNAFDRYEQDYRQKVEEMRALNLPRKGEHLMMLNSELRQQKKIVMSLKKKSLWSRKLEEVIEKLVDIVAFIRQEITEVFGTGQITSAEEAGLSTQRLGPAGLALHYANVINQMDNISSRPTSLPPNIRDTLYRGLPATVKDALRSKLRKLDAEEELDVPQIKAEMERILEWLSPVAMNTLKAHQGFGWVGEWANASTEFSKKTAGHGSIIRLQTFYHASKDKMDAYILTLVTLLHRLISGIKRVDHRDQGLRNLPLQSPSKKAFLLNSPLKIYPSLYNGNKTFRVELSEEDRRLLQKMSKSRLGSGISKSQELQKTRSKVGKSWAWSRSMESSPYRERRTGHLPDNELELVSRWIEAPF